MSKYNATEALLQRNVDAGQASKVAFIDGERELTYGELSQRVVRFSTALRTLGVPPESRMLMVMLDTVDFPVVFLGAIRAGVIPVPVNTLLTSEDYAYMLQDSRAKTLVVSSSLWPKIADIARKHASLTHVIVAGERIPETTPLEGLLVRDMDPSPCEATTADDTCFWLYTSGSTGTPKAAIHVHASLERTAQLYAQGVLSIDASDRIYSAAKLFFAYGLGNGLTFPLYSGATSILYADRPTTNSVTRILSEQRPTIFCGAPTLYASLLASFGNGVPTHSLRLCVSAGEALPAHLGTLWKAQLGVDIVDGLGSTEMLHIFLSNRPGDIRYGTTGRPVEGYEVQLVNELGQPVPRGQIGELLVKGPTAASCYWNQRERSRKTFRGEWTSCGDKYLETADGYFQYCGRSDDMLKVSGIYVSPFEVEATICQHPSVLETAVVGAQDRDQLIKPLAFVVLRPGHSPSPQLAADIQAHVKRHLAPYKYPRWVEFIDELPKTATGKIQRFALRARQRTEVRRVS